MVVVRCSTRTATVQVRRRSSTIHCSPFTIHLNGGRGLRVGARAFGDDAVVYAQVVVRAEDFIPAGQRQLVVRERDTFVRQIGRAAAPTPARPRATGGERGEVCLRLVLARLDSGK